jgi:ankyrin repeat protein
MENCYDILFFKLTSLFKEEDAEIADSIKKIHNIDFNHLGISNISFGQNLLNAIPIFQKILSKRTPEEKIECLMDSIKTLTSSTLTSALPINGDQLISLLLLLFIRSDVHSLYSTVYYINNFSFSLDIKYGEKGFALSSFEAVLSYIKTPHEELVVASEKCFEIVDNLERGRITSDINYSFTRLNYLGDNLFLLAIRLGKSVDILNDLLIHVDINICNFVGDTAFHILAHNGTVEIFKHLFKCAGKDSLLKKNNHGKTPLHIACERLNIPIIHEFLLSLQHDDVCNMVDNQGYSPLMYYLMKSSSSEDKESALLEKLSTSSNIYLVNSSGDNLLHFVTTLIELKFFQDIIPWAIQRSNDQRITPLEIICVNGNSDMISFVLPYAACCPIINEKNTIIHSLVQKPIALKLILEKFHPLINMLNAKGETALDLACKNKNYASLELLISFGADLYNLYKLLFNTPYDDDVPKRIQSILNNDVMVASDPTSKSLIRFKIISV